MFIQALNRHLCVCGIEEVQPILNRDRNFWNIISIRSPNAAPPSFRYGKAIHHAVFFDIENTCSAESQGLRAAQHEDLIDIMRFANTQAEEPLLIHCRAGVSRSTAVCLSLILQGCADMSRVGCSDNAVALLLSLRPRAIPNCLVLRLGLSTFMSVADATRIVEEVSNHPRLVENRFINPLRQ